MAMRLSMRLTGRLRTNNMESANEDIQTALDELEDSVLAIELGSVEEAVLKAAKKALVKNWNEHNHAEFQITEEEERELISQINQE